MELHRRRYRSDLVLSLASSGYLAFVLIRQATNSLWWWLCVVAAVAILAIWVVRELRPFRFGIDAAGITVRRRGLRRLVRWSEIDTVVLDHPEPSWWANSSPRLLLVPAAGTDLGVRLTAASPVDGRRALLLLDLVDVKESPREVGEALRRYAGNRFVDARPDPPPSWFSVVPRGYDRDTVDSIVGFGRRAIESGDSRARADARLAIERDRARLYGTTGGYDPGQVDEYLDHLAEQLAVEVSTL